MRTSTEATGFEQPAACPPADAGAGGSATSAKIAVASTDAAEGPLTGFVATCGSARISGTGGPLEIFQGNPTTCDDKASEKG